MLDQFSYYDNFPGKLGRPLSRLLYAEPAAVGVQALVVPAYRLEDAQGKWPSLGKREKEVHLMEIVREVGRACAPGQSPKIPAITNEEEAVAQAMLKLLAYSGGRGMNLGRLLLVVHLANCQEG